MFRSDAAKRLSKQLLVTEERGWWIKGRIPSFDYHFELSFEDHNKVPRAVLVHPQAPLTYLGLWDHRSHPSTLAEFQLGHWCKVPNDETKPHIMAILTLLMGVFPMYVPPDNRTGASGMQYRSRLP